MSSETDLQRDILRTLRVCGIRAIRINSGGRIGRVKLAPAGTPDILVMHPYCWLEVKDASKLSAVQRDWHRWAAEHGVPVFVVRTIGDAIRAVAIVREGLVLSDERSNSKHQT